MAPALNLARRGRHTVVLLPAIAAAVLAAFSCSVIIMPPSSCWGADALQAKVGAPASSSSRVGAAPVGAFSASSSASQSRRLDRSAPSSFRVAPPRMTVSNEDTPRGLVGFFSALTRNFSEAYREGFGTKARNVASTMKVGDVVVPLCSDLERRQSLANRGIYVGVEYEICSIEDGAEDDGVEEGGGVKERTALIKPAYPLRPHLERTDWPVPCRPLSDAPLWLNRNVYEAGTALGTAALALTTVATAAAAAFFVRFAVVPSESMLPAVAPGDVVFVSRSFPVGPFKPTSGDVVFFDPPAELDAAIANSKVGQAGGAVPTKGKQFLKRVVGVPGESVGVRDSEPYVLIADKDWGDEGEKLQQRVRADIVGPYSRPDVFPPTSWDRPPSILSSNEYFVAGDNGPRSVDSRVWGPLKDRYLFGTARMIVWPPEHIGPIGPGNFVEVNYDFGDASQDLPESPSSD